MPGSRCARVIRLGLDFGDRGPLDTLRGLMREEGALTPGSPACGAFASDQESGCPILTGSAGATRWVSCSARCERANQATR
jgi:hypothetical protein